MANIYDEICQVKEKYGATKKQTKKKNDDEKSGDMLKDTKIEYALDIASQFVYYFDGLTERENVNSDLKTFLAIVLVEISVFWTIKQQVSNCKQQMVYNRDSSLQMEQRLAKTVKEYIEWDVVNTALHDDLQHSLFHEVVTLQ